MIFHRINILSLCLLGGFLLWIKWLPGQQEFPIEFEFKGETYKVPSPEVKSENNTIIKTNNEFIIPAGKEELANFKIFIYDPKPALPPPEIRYSLKYDNSLIKLNDSEAPRPFKGLIDFSFSILPELSQEVRTKIKLEITDISSGNVVIIKSGSINLKILPTRNIAAKIDSCEGLTSKNLQLACLESLSSVVEDSKIEDVNILINKLTQEKEELKEQMNSFSLTSPRNNSVSLNCNNCNENNFSVHKNGEMISNNDWTFSSKKKFTLVITAKEWDIKKEIPYSPPSAPNRDKTTIILPEVQSEIKENDTATSDTNNFSNKNPKTKIDTSRHSSVKIRQNEDPKPELEFPLNPILLVSIVGAILLFIIIILKEISKKTPIYSNLKPSSPDSSEISSSKESQIENSSIDSSRNEGSSSMLGVQDEKEDNFTEEEFEILISETDRGVQETNVDQLTLEELHLSKDHYLVDIRSLWEDTLVHQIFLHQRSILAIEQLIQDQEYHFQESFIEDIPEIGGFLLGFIYQQEISSDDQTALSYDISIEHFVPITPEKQSRYMVRFGDQAWTELDDELQANPGLELVGWFHTHPGHGLFLSEADKEGHYELFGKTISNCDGIRPINPKP